MCIDFSELRVPISPERKKKNEWGDLKENGDFEVIKNTFTWYQNYYNGNRRCTGICSALRASFS